MITFKDLEKFGLGEKEAKVYLASLELGSATAAQIAQKAGVNRATTYVAIESLTKQGLLSSHEKDSKTFFSAEDPAMLKRLLDQQREEVKNKLSTLEELLPGLEQIYNYSGEKPKVRFFEGKEGLLTMQEEFLKTKDKKIETIFNVDSSMKVFSNSERKKYFEERYKKKIHVRSIYTGSNLLTKTDRFSKRLFVPKDKFSFLSEIVIYENKVAISSLQGKLIGVVIENKQITDTIRSFFNLAWEAAERYQR